MLMLLLMLMPMMLMLMLMPLPMPLLTTTVINVIVTPIIHIVIIVRQSKNSEDSTRRKMTTGRPDMAITRWSR